MEDSADDETYDDHGSIAELEANVECDGDDDVDTDDDTGGKDARTARSVVVEADYRKRRVHDVKLMPVSCVYEDGGSLSWR